MFHICAYSVTTTAAATLADMTAATDPALGIRSGHFILTSPFNLLGVYATGALNTQMEFSTPSINAVGPWNVYPTNLSVTTPGNVQIDDYRAYRPPLPMNEEIQLKASASGAETENAFLFLGTPGWTPDLGGLTGSSVQDSGVGRRLTLKVTAALTGVANGWSADGNVTFESSLRAGNYAVIGAEAFLAGALAFRINFLVGKPYASGRKLFPGDIVSQSYSLAPKRQGRNWLGIWGYFHNFEPPMVAVWANAAGGVTLNMLWDVVYLGGQPADLQGLVQGLAA